MANSADPDQLASSDLDLHCLEGRVSLGPAGQGSIQPNLFPPSDILRLQLLL